MFCTFGGGIGRAGGGNNNLTVDRQTHTLGWDHLRAYRGPAVRANEEDERTDRTGTQ